MQQIAMIGKNTVYSLSGLIIALAAMSAVLMALALRAAQKRPLGGMGLLAALSVLLAPFLSRFIHWYCRTSAYDSLSAAMSDLSTGGFAPVGVFAAVLLPALLLWLCKVYRDLGAVLDCSAVAGALGMAVGRLSCRFSTINRSKFTMENPSFHRLPFSVATTTAAGETEWRIASFCWEAVAALLIFLVLLLVFSRQQKRRNLREGDIFLLFLSLYGATHILLESMRYDGLFTRSNGFVSLPQICCTAALVLVTVLLSIRSVKANRGVKRRHILIWLLLLVCFGGGGYMEYYVQRHGNLFVRAYSIMGVCLSGIILLVILLLHSTAEKHVGKHKGVHL